MNRSYRRLLVATVALALGGCGGATRVASSSAPPAPRAAPPPPPPVVSAPPTGSASMALAGSRATGSAWLIDTEPEPAGFGMYSYLLFGSRPSAATRPLYVAVVKAGLEKINTVGQELKQYPPAQLNLYMTPILSGPPANLTADGAGDGLAEWIVDHYNYPRAGRILGTLSGQRSGVYILSVLGKPLDTSQALQPPYLWQDLTGAAPTIMDAWIQYFLDQSAKDKPWESSMGERLALDMRNGIEKAALATQSAVPALSAAIQWFKV